jgi:sugar/nucleoside kinase (ribokinase family)
VNSSPVLCIGILVADVFVPPLERLPGAGELVATDDFLIQSGGCAANVAIALRKLGVRAAVCGRVGDDAFGEFIERDLRSHRIDTSGVRRTAGYGTSKTVILPVTGEDRRYIHSFGANTALTVSDINSSMLNAARAVYVGGYLILPGLRDEQLALVLLEARARGTKIVLDIAAPAGRDPSLESVRMLLPVADYFVPNVDEARMLTGTSDPGRQASCLIEQGARTVVIKLGERGTYIRSGEQAFELPAGSVDVVEPSGAGDAFAAGLVVGILEGWSIERMVRFASVIGASACTALGCSAGVFTRPEAEAYLETHPLPSRAPSG